MGNSKNKNKYKKIQKRSKQYAENGRSGGRPRKHQTLQVINAEEHYESCSDEDPAGDDYDPQIRQQTRLPNDSSVCLMLIGVLNSILKDFALCKECREGSLQCNVTSYGCLNTKLVFQCDNCRVERTRWSGSDKINQAALMSAKFSGIKLRQLQNWATCMNFGFRNHQGKDFAVNLSKPKTTKMNEEINIKLDTMKMSDENMLCEKLLDANDKENVELAIDGMYPIRNDSGICLSSVMATINGTKKIIGEILIKNPLFFKNVPLEK